MGRTARPSAGFLAKCEKLSGKSTNSGRAAKGSVRKKNLPKLKPKNHNFKNGKVTKASARVKRTRNAGKAVSLPKEPVKPARKSTRTVTAGTPGTGRKRAAISTRTDAPVSKLPRVDSLNTQLQRALKVAAKGASKAPKASGGKTYKLDAIFKRHLLTNAKIHADYCCMLNQTNIGHNNNKYYVIQLAEIPGGFNRCAFFTRWGRVGEDGQNQVQHCDLQTGIKYFEKKFYDKTSNIWSQRSKFIAVPGKYTLLDMEEEDEADSGATPASKAWSASACVPALSSKLDERTQKMARLIFSKDMFCKVMENMSLDIKKMPLGKLSKTQIGKGLDALINIEKAIKLKKGRPELTRLSSEFYTLVPHNFGRSLPPLICTAAQVQQKKDMLITLADIELTQSLQKNKWIKDFANACPNSRKCTLLDVWKVDRNGEHSRFCKNSGVAYRKLLWHGTNVAVVAAILNSGLRIMPHSGGRVGRGIYFASEHAKSSFYVSCHYGKFEDEQNVGFMFLVEVALGKSKEIEQGDSTLAAPPKGFDSIVARGRTEPDTSKDLKVKLEGKTVIVPKGKPKSVPQFSNSSFSQSEYLVYREDQARIRYMLKFSFA